MDKRLALEIVFSYYLSTMKITVIQITKEQTGTHCIATSIASLLGMKTEEVSAMIECRYIGMDRENFDGLQAGKICDEIKKEVGDGKVLLVGAIVTCAYGLAFRSCNRIGSVLSIPSFGTPWWKSQANYAQGKKAVGELFAA